MHAAGECDHKQREEGEANDAVDGGMESGERQQPYAGGIEDSGEGEIGENLADRVSDGVFARTDEVACEHHEPVARHGGDGAAHVAYARYEDDVEDYRNDETED